MSLARGRFGIEFDPDRNRGDGASGLRWVVGLVLLAVAVSLTVSLVGRLRGPADEVRAPDPAPAETPPDGGQAPAAPPVPEPRGFDEVFAGLPSRTGKVRALLMKVKEAQEQGRIPDEVDAIDQLRDLPGNSALDLNNLLARRLGELNLTWLFDRYNPQWVTVVKAKSGDSASRIAQEYGATLASLKRLNPGVDVERLRVGDEVRVMNRPRFYLCVYPNTRKADLQLKGRFFKRYDLREPVSGKPGTYEPTGSLRTFLAEHGVWFNLADRQELEMLLPRKFTFVIGDL